MSSTNTTLSISVRPGRLGRHLKHGVSQCTQTSIRTRSYLPNLWWRGEWRAGPISVSWPYDTLSLWTPYPPPPQVDTTPFSVEYCLEKDDVSSLYVIQCRRGLSPCDFDVCPHKPPQFSPCPNRATSDTLSGGVGGVGKREDELRPLVRTHRVTGVWDEDLTRPCRSGVSS